MTTRREAVALGDAIRRARVDYYLRKWRENELLAAVTAGMEVERFITVRQQETVAMLRDIDSQIVAFLAANPPSPPPALWERAGRLLNRFRRAKHDAGPNFEGTPVCGDEQGGKV